jgi:hypothetical protein
MQGRAFKHTDIRAVTILPYSSYTFLPASAQIFKAIQMIFSTQSSKLHDLLSYPCSDSYTPNPSSTKSSKNLTAHNQDSIVGQKHFVRYYSTSTTNCPSIMNVMQEGGPVCD